MFRNFVIVLFRFILPCVVGFPFPAGAQNTALKSKLWMEGRFHYGFIIPHHENMVPLTEQHLTMFGLDLHEATNGDHYWERQHKLPLKGISILFSDLGGAPALGKVVGVLPYLDFPLTHGKKVNLFFRFGAGVGYLSKHFSRIDNYKNIAIGSHFNAGIQLMYSMRWRPVPRLELLAGLSLTHFSNGAVKMPNLGINIATLSAGCAFKLDSVSPVRITTLQYPVSHKWEYSVFALFGFSELYAAYGPKFPAFLVSATFLKPFGFRGKRKIGAGLDVFYDEAVVESLSRIGQPVSHRIEAVRPGLSLTYETKFSRLSLVLQLGAYVYTAYKKDGYIYNRMAPIIYISDISDSRE